MNKYSEYVKTDALRMARLSRKFTYKDMSNKLGFKTATSYYNIEVGKSMPTIKVMNDIASILKETVEKFFNIKVQQS